MIHGNESPSTKIVVVCHGEKPSDFGLLHQRLTDKRQKRAPKTSTMKTIMIMAKLKLCILCEAGFYIERKKSPHTNGSNVKFADRPKNVIFPCYIGA